MRSPPQSWATHVRFAAAVVLLLFVSLPTLAQQTPTPLADAVEAPNGKTKPPFVLPTAAGPESTAIPCCK